MTKRRRSYQINLTASGELSPIGQRLQAMLDGEVQDNRLYLIPKQERVAAYIVDCTTSWNARTQRLGFDSIPLVVGQCPSIKQPLQDGLTHKFLSVASGAKTATLMAQADRAADGIFIGALSKALKLRGAHRAFANSAEYVVGHFLNSADQEQRKELGIHILEALNSSDPEKLAMLALHAVPPLMAVAPTLAKDFLPALTMLANNPYDDYKDASFNAQRHALPAIRKALKAAPAP